MRDFRSFWQDSVLNRARLHQCASGKTKRSCSLSVLDNWQEKKRESRTEGSGRHKQEQMVKIGEYFELQGVGYKGKDKVPIVAVGFDSAGNHTGARTMESFCQFIRLRVIS